jgi:hypothetical protein
MQGFYKLSDKLSISKIMEFKPIKKLQDEMTGGKEGLDG